ncbi:MAG TPA: hypothetical protein VF549_14950 [Solirubrobacteraceae bacterium]|jgi:uncharacterized membrane protein
MGKAAITINKPRDEVQRLWESADHGSRIEGAVTFSDAPGDRGTEMHVEFGDGARGGKIGEIVQKVAGTEPLAKAKDELRRFKQRVETGEIARSEGMPQGESLEGKPAERPAQPLEESELQEAGV